MTHKFSFLYYFSIIFCFFVLSPVSSSLHADDVMQYENQMIERVDIVIMNLAEGAPSDVNAIAARIKSKIGDLFCQAVFDNDLKILAQDFDRIDPNIDCIEGKVYITLKIWPKPTIRTITWNGNCKVKTEDLQEELAVTSCSIFDRYAFNQAFHKLKAYYVKKGFFEAELAYDIIPDPCSNQVDIQININEGRAGRIKDIRFFNFTCDEQDEILAKMVTKEYSFFTSWMTDEGTYRQEAMQQDEMIIVNYLHNLGYADAKVRIEISEAKQNERIIISIIADKGNRYTLGKLVFQGNTLFSDDEIWERFLIKEGDCYSPEKVHATIESITNLYGKYGYIDTVIDYEPRLVADQCVYDITFNIEECEQFRVGLIRVFGNCSTQTSVILHETLLIPGEIFNIQKLQITEDRLTNIGFFKSVNVYAVKSEGPYGLGNNYRDVHIEVEETSTGNFGAFFGFSTAESIFGGFNITENNFNIAGLGSVFSRGLCALRGGGEYAFFTATIGAKSNSYQLSWTKPWFMDTPWVIGFDIERSTTGYISDDYNIESTGLTLRAAYQLNPFVRAGFHYRVKYTHIDVTDHDASEQLDEEARNSGLITAVGTSLAYDSTNHPVTPTRGFKSRVELEVAGTPGRHRFLGFGYINSVFWQFPEFDTQGVWRFRGDARFLQPLEPSSPTSIPIDERFFLGGNTTIRGFRPYKLGPLYNSGDPRGGISMQYLSLEYTRPLFKRFDVFYFIDAGHLTLKRWDITDGRFSVSFGYGLRIAIFPNTPPLVLGMGYPINAKKGEAKRFFLTIGGQF